MSEPTLLSIGECMVELTDAGQGLLRQSFAGDSFNMAYYARHALPKNWRVEYYTAVGIDKTSSDMIAFMEANGVGVRFIHRNRRRSLRVSRYAKL